MFSEKIKKSNRKWIFLTILICLMFLNIFVLFFSYNNKTSISTNNTKSQTLLESSFVDQWIKESHEKDWIDDSEFNIGKDWSIVKAGSDISDVDASISGGQANYDVLGDNKSFILPSKPLTGADWTETINTAFPTLPDDHDFKAGCWVHHERVNEESDQMVSVHWEHNVSLTEDMSDYSIISGQIWAKVNATVHSDEIRLGGGIEAYKDATEGPNTQNATFDYIRFYVQISDLNKKEVYEVAHYQTINLGRDSAPYGNHRDYLYDTLMIPIPEESLKFYLSSVLNYDHHNFTIILGMRIWSEDNWLQDNDIWDALRIKSFNITLNYVKKIDQFTSVYFKYDRKDELTTKKGNIKITGADMNFDFKTNVNWKVISPNSEIRILVNDQEHKESVKLIDAEGTFKEAKDEDFDLTSLIPTDEDIVIVIQLILADEFNLENDIFVSIDNVELKITYDLFLPAEQSLLYEILLIGVIVAAVLLVSYFIYYQKVLKYPKPVRKVRKFKKTLKHKNPPNVSIIGQNEALTDQFNKKTIKTSDLLRTRKKSPEIVAEKLYGKGYIRIKSKNKSIDKLKESFKNKNALIVIVILLLLFLSVIIFCSKTPAISTSTTHKNSYLFLSQNSDNDQWIQIPHSEQWVKNSEFDNDDGWNSEVIGDSTDVSANIKDGAANYAILGNTYSFIAASGKPNASDSSMGWKKVINRDFPSYPDVAKINSSGCFASHNWWNELADQSPSVHWDKNITMPLDMSDYIITSVSLRAVFNASVKAVGNGNAGGIEAGNDVPQQYATKDYAKFYVLLSDLEKNKVYEVAYNQTTNLGQDSIPLIDHISDSEMTIVSNEYLKYFLSSVLSTDNRHFTATLGIRIWSEDNWGTDYDTWTYLIIKSFDLSFNYIKKINRETTVSWKYDGEKLKGENIEITDGKLYFDYKIDNKLSLSPNSEMRILINDELFGETFKLSTFNNKFEEAEEDGLDVTELIPNDEKISVKIQVYIADEFGLGNTYTVSIDNVILDITYNELLSSEQSLLIQILIIIGAVGLACLATYIVYYQRVLKYPKPVRKVRKFRRKLSKKKAPKITIIDKKNAFNASYKSKFANVENLLKASKSTTQKNLGEEKRFIEDIRTSANDLKGKSI